MNAGALADVAFRNYTLLRMLAALIINVFLLRGHRSLEHFETCFVLDSSFLLAFSLLHTQDEAEDDSWKGGMVRLLWLDRIWVTEHGKSGKCQPNSTLLRDR